MERFRENYISVELIRIGGEKDGSYLVPDIFEDIEFCFSPGIGDEINFEKHLSDVYGIKSFMVDNCIKSPPVFDDHFEFERKTLSSRDSGDCITLKSRIDKKLERKTDIF